MPLYEYQCKACGVRFERHQSMTDGPVGTCPECGGEVHRLIHPVGVIFKGKGFYVTDNRKAKSSTAIPTSKEESKDESKPSTEGKKIDSSKSEGGEKSE
jgi:putative FmdB family regulatory protein